MLGSGLLDSKVRINERSPVLMLMQLYYAFTDIYEVKVQSMGSENDKLFDALLKIKFPPMARAEEKIIESQVDKLNEMEDFVKNVFRSK